MFNFLLQSIIRFVSSMPLPRALALGKKLGWFYGSVIRYHRKDALEALQRTFPEKSLEEINGIIDRMYAQLGMNAVEISRLAGGKPDNLEQRITIEGEDIAREVLAQGKGALILVAHFGNWDLLGMFTAKRGYPLTIISKTIKNPTLNAMWMKLRNEYGVKIIPARNSYRDCLKVLRKNELLGFILDQNRPLDQGVFVDFFGKSACTSPGLAYMAAQSKAPVMPVFIHRISDSEHVLKVYPPLPPPPDREQASILAATQQYTKVIEDEIRKYPDHWLWIHRRWKTQPPKETAPEGIKST
ncbi:MAG: lysophospholipid acyltransferase family protein [Lentisphaerota bacterium]